MAHDPFSDKAAENFLEGSATAAKWPKVGYVVEGTVLNYRMAQQSSYEDSEPLFWEGKKMVIESKAVDKSRPVMQLIMEVQGAPTGETWEGLQNVRKALPDDNGVRTLYVKANLQRSLKEALGKAGSRLEVGAYIRVERVSDGEQSDKKKQAPHRYASVWTPAKQNAAHAQSFMDEPEEAPF